jgi:serine/threonine-protein kinase RIO1
VLENLAVLKITHGDLKMTNILIANQQPVLIDLDGMCEHQTFSGFKRVFNQEIKRFMENWRHLPAVQRLFEELMMDALVSRQKNDYIVHVNNKE